MSGKRQPSRDVVGVARSVPVSPPETRPLETGDISARASDVRKAPDKPERSVTRTVLRNMVREALVEILTTEGETVFPELGERRSASDLRAIRDEVKRLRQALGAELNALRSESSRYRQKIQRAFLSRLEKLNERVSSLESNLPERLDSRLEQELADVGQQFADLAVDVEGQLEKNHQSLKDWTRQEIMKGNERLGELRDMIQDVVEKLPPGEVFRRLEERLEAMEGQIRELTERLDRTRPHERFDRRLLNAESEILERLERSLEVRFQELADRLDSWQGGVSESTTSDAEIQNLQAQLVRVTDQIGVQGRNVVDHRRKFFDSLEDFKRLLEKNLESRELKRGLVNRRILDLRDSLRQRLVDLSEGAGSGRRSFWERMSGKSNGSPRLTVSETESFRDLLEDVLEGLEFLIFENGKNGSA